MKYTINWRKVINAHDKVSIGILTQARIADICGVSNPCISTTQYEPFGKRRLERFRKLHDLHFKQFIEFDEVYTEINDDKV
jgi:hypothetical protein